MILYNFNKSQYFAPEPGAAQIRLGELSKELKKKAVDVRIITGMPNYPEGKIFDEYKYKFTKSETWNDIPISRIFRDFTAFICEI